MKNRESSTAYWLAAQAYRKTSCSEQRHAARIVLMRIALEGAEKPAELARAILAQEGILVIPGMSAASARAVP